MKELVKNVIKLSFFVTFIIFSLQSINSYLKGEVIFENINEYKEHLVFPSLTICPKLKGAIGNLKTDLIAADLNISIEQTNELPKLIQRYRDPMSFVQNYTFSKKDIFLESKNSAFM